MFLQVYIFSTYRWHFKINIVSYAGTSLWCATTKQYIADNQNRGQHQSLSYTMFLIQPECLVSMLYSISSQKKSQVTLIMYKFYSIGSNERLFTKVGRNVWEILMQDYTILFKTISMNYTHYTTSIEQKYCEIMHFCWALVLPRISWIRWIS